MIIIKKKLVIAIIALVALCLLLLATNLFRNPYAQGIDALSKGSWEKAERHFSTALQKDKSSAVYLGCTQALIALEKYNTAKEIIDEAFSTLPPSERKDFASSLSEWIQQQGMYSNVDIDRVFTQAEFFIPWTDLLIDLGELDRAYSYLQEKPPSIATENLAISFFKGGDWDRLASVINIIEWLTPETMTMMFQSGEHDKLITLFQTRPQLITKSLGIALLSDVIPLSSPELLAFIVTVQPEALIENSNSQRITEIIIALNEYQPAESNPEWLQGFERKDFIISRLSSIHTNAEFLSSGHNTSFEKVLYDSFLTSFTNNVLEQGSLYEFLDFHRFNFEDVTDLNISPNDNGLLVWHSHNSAQSVSFYDFKTKEGKLLKTGDGIWGGWSTQGTRFALQTIIGYEEEKQGDISFYNNTGMLISIRERKSLPDIYSFIGWANEDRIYARTWPDDSHVFIYVDEITPAPQLTTLYYPRQVSLLTGQLVEEKTITQMWWAFPLQNNKYCVALMNENYDVLRVIPGLWSETQIETLTIGDSILAWYEDGEIVLKTFTISE